MKKKIVLLSAAVLSSLVIGLTGCSKDDTTSPVVTLNGASVVDVILNGTYTEESATANDDEDGAIAVTVSGTVNEDRAGEYTITYTATDEAGNVGTATRIVNVYNQAEIFDGVYDNCVDVCDSSGTGNYTSTVWSSDSINKLVKIGNFGAFDSTNAVLVYATFTGNDAGDDITISTPQQVGATGNATVDVIFQNETDVVSGTSTSTAFRVKYRWSDGSWQEVCSSTYNR